MIYTIEGTPKTQTLELPTGEEIQLKLPEGGGMLRSFYNSQLSEQEEEFVPDERLLVIDDSLLAKLTLRFVDTPSFAHNIATKQKRKRMEKLRLMTKKAQRRVLLLPQASLVRERFQLTN